MGDEAQCQPEGLGCFEQAGFIAFEFSAGEQPHALSGHARPAQSGANGSLDIGGSRAAPTADAHDVVAHGFAGGGDHRFGGDGIGHTQRQIVGAALMPREQGNRPPPQGIAADHGGVTIFRLHQRREAAGHHPAGRQHHQSAGIRPQFGEAFANGSEVPRPAWSRTGMGMQHAAQRLGKMSPEYHSLRTQREDVQAARGRTGARPSRGKASAHGLAAR